MTSEEKVRRFERALAHAGNTHSISDVLDQMREQRAVCWRNGDSVIVTEVVVSPRVRACNYWIVAGRLHECAELQPAIDAWAISEGCSVATATGRMGWLRLSQTPFGSDWKAA
ncbi:MAG TPA: hypothetical protein VJY85_03665, partial [Candidatus Limnocylindria bacterium]|nr:hypothetical protein [Candidatus Limnocylindria bacterium]